MKSIKIKKDRAYSLIIRPIFTEKAMSNVEQNKVYVFEVDKSANKLEIKSAIETIFSVTVRKVNIVNKKGEKTFFKGVKGKKKDMKKAVVQLSKGVIDISGGAA